MRKIASVNRKGGVGKTSVAIHLAAGLARLGHNVLLVDTDPQGHAGISLGIKKEPGLFNLLVEDALFNQVLRGVPLAAYTTPDDTIKPGRFFVLPSDEKTGVIQQLNPDVTCLRDKLEDIEDHFEFAIIDTAPTVTMFDSTLYMAADEYLYVIECEKLSLDGLANGLKQLEKFSKGYSVPKELIGIQPNKFRDKTANHMANLNAVTEHFKDKVYPPIPQRTLLSEAGNVNQTVFAYAPSSDISERMAALTDRILAVSHERE